MAETTLLVYAPLAVIGFSILLGAVGGYWIGRGEGQARLARAHRLVEGLRAELAPTTPKPPAPKRGRHARGGSQ